MHRCHTFPRYVGRFLLASLILLSQGYCEGVESVESEESIYEGEGEWGHEKVTAFIFIAAVVVLVLSKQQVNKMRAI